MTARMGGYEFFKISESLSKRKGLKLTMMFPQIFIHNIKKYIKSKATLKHDSQILYKEIEII